MSARSRKRHRRAGRKRNPFLLALLILSSVAALVVLSFGVYVLSVAAEAPPISELQPLDKGASSAVYASDGALLGYIQSDELRTPVPLSRIPKDLQYATVAIEDARFYEHGGIDLEGIARAAVKNLQAGETREGGSTITMQLVRNLYIADPQRDIERKIREAKLAQELENEHDKAWIMEQYLNSASYGTIDGRTAVGVEAAAQTYFNKPVKDLTLEQSALLAGLPQSPSLYNPLLNPAGARERRNEVLERMAEVGYISAARAQEAYQAPLGIRRGDRYTKIREPYFFDYVEQQLIDEYGVNTVRRGGLKVMTTIDRKLQKAARQAIRNNLYYPDDPSSALVAIDPRNGFIRAMASSGSYRDQQYNLAAQGRRQPGSAAKTWALTAAVRRGVDPDSTYYVSKPLNLDLPEYGKWEVATYSNSYAGSISLHQATLLSDNTVYAQLALDLGPESVADTAHDMGIDTKLEGLPAETLGGLRLGVSPLEMTNAYATLASGGVRNKPIAIREVQFPDGNVDQLGEPERRRVFSDAVAYEVVDILIDNVSSGTGTAAATGCGEQGGKTGTTDDFNDAMFMGVTPKLVAGVWVGYPDALRSMTSVHGIAVAGGTFPAQIWHDFMAEALSECTSFPEPKSEIEWIPFYGTYASRYGSDSCVTGGSELEPVSCGYDYSYEPVPEDDGGKKKKGDYAPGVGQKPLPPKPEKEPEPEPEPEPPPPPPPPPEDP